MPNVSTSTPVYLLTTEDEPIAKGREYLDLAVGSVLFALATFLLLAGLPIILG